MASESWIEPYPCLPPQTQDDLGSNCFLKGQISRFPFVAPYHFLSLIICCRHIKIGTLSIDMLSMVCNDVLDFIYDTHGHRITQWNPTILSPADLQIYSDTVAVKGADLHDCFGFIAGTVRYVDQESSRGYCTMDIKGCIALNFRLLRFPIGLIGNLYGAVGK